LRVQIDVQKPLRRGVLVAVDSQEKVWVSFKYEHLPIFCFGCGRLGHGVKECQVLSSVERERSDGDFPYSVELKIDSKKARNVDSTFDDAQIDVGKFGMLLHSFHSRTEL
ncbi:hypothetical protein Golob_011913, partial [Gossypium lobatum]|nr:hypothetical protein [Gossypium lobatum]